MKRLEKVVSLSLMGLLVESPVTFPGTVSECPTTHTTPLACLVAEMTSLI